MLKRLRLLLALGAVASTVSACQGDTPNIGVHNTCDIGVEVSVQSFNGGSYSWHRIEPRVRQYVGSVSERFDELFVSIRASTDAPVLVDRVTRSSLLSVQPENRKKYADLEYVPSVDVCERVAG